MSNIHRGIWNRVRQVSLLLLLGMGLPAAAHAALTVTPLTWNIVGLDSNSPTAGPKNFPIGARICSNTATINVAASFVFDSANANINLRPGSLSTLNFASIAAGACIDAYFEVEVNQVAAAYDTTRRYHVTASDGTGTYSTPVPRELYVEHLISQSRNSIADVKYGTNPASLVSVGAGGALNLVVGNTYTIELDGGTATQGYEQFETFINFSNAIFQILAVNTTYSADSSIYVPNPNSKLYADACLWESDPNGPNYRSCIGVAGKAGGSNVVTTYTIKIVSGGGTSQTLNTLLYDFSGSSFHYNGDYSVGARVANIIDPTTANISKSFSPNPAPVNGVSALTITLTNPNTGALSGYNFVDNLPAGMTIATPSGATTAGCGTPTLTAVAGAGTISFSAGTVAGNGNCVIKVNVTTAATGSFVNTTGNLFIDTVDTGHNATATLTVNNAPPPGPGICGVGLATWKFPTGYNINAPAATTSSVTVSAVPGAGTTPISETTITADGTAAWGSNGSITTGTPLGTANNEYFEFGLDTTGLTSVSLGFNAQFRSANGPKGVAVFYGTTNTRPETGTSLLNNSAALTTQNTPVAFNVTANSGLNPSGTTFFRIYFFNSNNTNAGSDPVLDDVVFTACGAGTPPTISKTFAPNPIAVNGVSTLTFALANANATALTGAAFTDALPAGTQVAAAPAAATTCGGTWAPTAGATALTFSGGTIPANSSCSVSVNITATTAGPHGNISGFLSTTETGTNTATVASATLTALSPPRIAKNFSPSPIIASGISRLTFTINNPNPNDTMSGVAFGDTLPVAPGAMVVAPTPNASSSGCGVPTFAPLPGAAALAFSSGTIGPGGSCTVNVDVTAPTVGTYNNTSGLVSFSINAQTVTGNTASASLIVGPPHPAIGLLKQIGLSAAGPWLDYTAVALPGNVFYRFTIENAGDVPLSPVTLSDPQINTSSCTPPASLPVAVAANNNHIFTCVVGPVAATAGNHPNTATASGTGGGSTVNDSSSATYASATMSLAKSVTETSYTVPGNTLHYSYLVTNTGAATLDGPITVNDNKVAVTCPPLNTIGDLDNFFDPGESLTCTAIYVVTAADVSAASVTNTAQATNGTILSNTDSRTVPLSSSADVSVVKTLVTPGPYTVGQSLTFTLFVANGGPSTATNVQVTDTPTNLTIVNVSGGGCAALPCTIPSLASGANVTITVTATINASGAFDNSTTVSAVQPDPDPTNNTDNTGNGGTSGASADLSITKTDGVANVTAGGTTTYTITASNAGPSAVVGATVADTFPAAITAATWTCSGAGGGTCTASGSGNINAAVNLPSGASVTFIVSATISASASGTLTNTATVTAPAGVTDPTPGNNSATDIDTIAANADLSITKTDGVTTVTAGGSTTYTIVASNAGPSSVTGATVADTFPAALTATWTCVGAGGGTCTASGSGNINATVNLPVGASVIFTVSATISASATGTLSNTATVTAPAGVTDPTPGNNSATDSDTIAQQADLSITKTDGVTTVNAGGTTTYTITASNAGPSAVTGATVADTFPASLTATWTCSGASGGTCTASGSGNINASVNLPVGASVTFIVSANISAAASGTLTNTATVTAPAGVTDPTPGNNSATDSDTINKTADLSITKTDGVASVTAGGTTTYTIMATNAGPSAVTGATVADTFPASLTATWTCVGASGGTCTASGSGNINDTVNLPVGASVTYTVSATISAGASGTLTNTATVTAPAGVTDPTPGNNSATDTDTIGGTADLSITKTDGVATVIAGGTTTYTITASNAGPSAVTGATITDTFPASLTATWTCVGAGGGTCTASGSGNINGTVNLPVGGSVIYTVSATISASATGTLSNTATVTAPAGVTDPTPGNNTATDTDTINKQADLSITKTDGVATVTAGGTTIYTITASNAGPSAVTGATIADTFPASLTATWTCVGASGGTCTASGSGNINDTVNLPVGASVTYTVSATINASASGTLTNTATVTAPAGVTDPTPGNNTATDSDTIAQQADLAITKSDGTANYAPGGTLTYAIVVSNNGPSSVTGATIADTFGAAFASDTWTATSTGGASGFAASGSGNINATVNMPVGSTITYTVTATVSLAATGSLSNTATVTAPAGVTDPNPANNSATDTDNNGGTVQLAIAKSATPGAFAVGQTGTYSLLVSNTGTTSTSAAIVVNDPLPAGITTTATPSGAGWNCSASTTTNVSCTTAAVLLPGGSAPIINVPVTIAVGTASPAVNTATVSGGGDPGCPAAANCASTISTPVNAPLINVTKTLTGNFVVGVQTSYIITATNNGQAATLAGTIADTIPTGLTIGTLPPGCSSGGGQNVNCTLPAGIAVGGSVSYTIPVTPQASANGQSVSNTATASGGGDPSCPAASHCDGTVTNTVTAPQLQLTKTATPSPFVVGQVATYTLTLTNTGTAATTATVTITDTIPGGLTIGALPAGCAGAGQTVTCTIAAPLNTGAPVVFNIPVTPQASLDGQSVTNSAGATGGGDPGCPNLTPIGSLPARCVGTVVTSVNAPQLTIQKSASAAGFVVGVAATYTLQVTNTGTAATTSTATITDVIPGTLTIGTLPAGCSATGQQVTCTIATGLATGSSVSFVIPVTPTAAASGTSLSNTATVSGGGDPTCPTTANCSSTVVTPVDAPQLTIVKTASAPNFVVGVAASYTLTVTNTGTAPTTAAATITDTIPGTLTIGTLPAGCSAAGQVVTCTIAAPLNTSVPVSFTIPVTPTAAASGTSLSNTASVTGGGDPSCPGATNCSSTVITPVNTPQLQIVKSASASSFVVGVAASYTLTVTNTGSAATTATANAVDNVPGTLTLGTLPGGCSATGQQVTCTIAAPLAPNTPVTFVIPVTPTAAASGTTLINTATISGGGDPGCPAAANCTSTVSTPVGAPQLQVVKTASAPSFVVGTPASYTLTVTNIGSAATTSTATVVDNIPGTLTIGTLPGGCTAAIQQVSCTIAAPLAPNAPVSFTIPVTPTAAAGNTTVTNTATVSGGGDPTCPAATNCTSTVDTPVTVLATSADLHILKIGPAQVTAGQNIVYTITVTNVGPDSALNAVLSDPAPAGLTFVSSGAPCPTFPCSLGNIALNQSITIPNVTFHVAANYGTGMIVNVASVTSSTPDPTPNNNSSSASTPVVTGATPSVAAAPIDARWMLLMIAGLLGMVGARPACRRHQPAPALKRTDR